MSKPCKFGCNTILSWDTANGRFIEETTKIIHDKTRCESLRSKVVPSPQNNQTLHSVQQIDNDLLRNILTQNIKISATLTEILNTVASINGLLVDDVAGFIRWKMGQQPAKFTPANKMEQKSFDDDGVQLDE